MGGRDREGEGGGFGGCSVWGTFSSSLNTTVGLASKYAKQQLNRTEKETERSSGLIVDQATSWAGTAHGTHDT